MLNSSRVNLTQLITLLPRLTSKPTLVADQGLAFDVAPACVDGYIQPSLVIDEWPDNAGVLLIEAAGAVGKSALASCLADLLNWPLVRAEKAQVGSFSLSGLIQDALGFADPYMQYVATGAAGVVVDSLDEAHFKAGEDNFLAFIDNVQKCSGWPVQGAPRRPSIVLLSRSDTAELVRASFVDSGVPLANARLDFFDYPAACAFIRSYFRQRFDETRRPEYNVDISYQQPFERLRDARMRDVATTLVGRDVDDLRTDWDAVAEFLGYAPVLIAMAEFLAVRNPAAEKKKNETVKQRDFLLGIVLSILDREQGKFADSMLAKLRAKLPADASGDVSREILYTRSEQVARVAAFVTKNRLASPGPASLPTALRQDYEDAAEAFVANHPFVRGHKFASIVFADYINATSCTELEVRAALEDSPESRIESVGAFFAAFVVRKSKERYEISENLVENVIVSWYLEADLRGLRNPSCTVLLYADGHSSIEFSPEPGKEGDTVEISGVSGAFYLRRPLRNMQVLSDGALILGDRGERLTLGPSFVVIVEDLVLEAELMSTAHGRGVGLWASTIEANYLKRVDSRPGGLIVLCDESVPVQLRPFAIPEAQLPRSRSGSSIQDYVALRAILTSFKPAKQGPPSVYWEKLEKTIIRGKPNRQRILRGLMDRGCIKRRGDMYQIESNAFGAVGFSLTDAKSGYPNVAILAFLDSCAEKGAE